MNPAAEGSQASALGLALLLSIIALFIAKRFGFFKLPESKISSLPTFWQMVGSFLIYLIVSSLIIPFAYLVAIFVLNMEGIKSLEELSKSWRGWLQVTTLVAVLGAFLVYCYFQRASVRWIMWRDHQPSWRLAAKDFGIGALTWAVSYPTVICASIFSEILSQWIWGKSGIEQVAVKQLLETKGEPFLFVAMILVVIAVVPFIEELLFRGFLQNWLRRKIGRFRALVLTAVLFALVHFSTSQGIGNFELIVSLFTLSCFLGFIYERQGTLWAAFGLHVTFNAVSVIALSFIRH